MSHASIPPLLHPTTEEKNAGRGFAIASLVLAVVGFCVPLLGLLAILFGILAIVRGRSTWRGLGVGGLVAGVASLFISILVLGLLLPALAKARETARMVKSKTQLNLISKAMAVYQNEWSAMPADGTDIESVIVSQNYTGPQIWVSPQASTDRDVPSYLFVTLDPASLDPSALFIIENPELGSRRVNVVTGDLAIREVDRAEAINILRQQKTLYTSRGETWTLPSDLK